MTRVVVGLISQVVVIMRFFDRISNPVVLIQRFPQGYVYQGKGRQLTGSQQRWR